jgi:adenine-specific DNA-methyltransferase
MQRRYREKIKCVYIDPPYNAKSSEIMYKNDYKHSSWLTMMNNRVSLSLNILNNEGVYIIAIDENEQEKLGILIKQIFPNMQVTCITVIHNPAGIQGENFSYCHEYAYFIYPQGNGYIGRVKKSKEDIVPLRDWGGVESKRETAKNCFYPIFVKNGVIIGFGDVCPDNYHPLSAIIKRSDGIIEIYPIDSNGVERKWRHARQSIEKIRDQLTCDKVNGQLVIRRHKSIYRYKTVWLEEKYFANTFGSKLTNEILGFSIENLFPKSIFTVYDSLYAITHNKKNATILDYFAGSGTTGHAVINLNREDGGQRKFILVEMADYFDTVLLPRLKKVTFTPEWKDGKPKRFATKEETERSPRIFKYIRLESYEDTLNNLELRRTETQEQTLFSQATPQKFREEYILQYMLAVESRDSLLPIQVFRNPVDCKLTIKRPGSEESRRTNVDLLETFNWLIGISVEHIAAPQSFAAGFIRDSEGRLKLKSPLKQEENGRWWFRRIEGTNPDGRKTLIVWRNLTGNLEEDNLVLDTYMSEKLKISTRDFEFDLIYVNGSNNLENLKLPDDTWKVRLIEEDFHHLMFEMEDV